MSVLDYIDADIFTPVYQNGLPAVNSPRVDAICKELFYAIKANEPIFIYGDYDADGFYARQVWTEVLSTLYSVPPIHFRYERRMHTIDPSIVDQAKASGARIVLILDSGSSTADFDIESLLRFNGHTPIVIDHHNWEGDYIASSYHNLIFNSHEENQLLGGAEVSGAYASLLVASHLCTKYFKHSISYNAMVYALASMYSDVVDLATPAGRALYNAVQLITMPGPVLMEAMNDWGYTYSRRLFSYIISPKINACFRSEEFDSLNGVFKARDKYEIRVVADRIKAVHNSTARLVDMFAPLFSREVFGDILLCVHQINEQTRALHIRNYSGLIANKISQEEKKMVIVVLKDSQSYAGSFRDFYNRKMLSTFKLFCKADGHDTAFGIEFANLNEFKRHLRSLSGMTKVSTKNDYDVLSSSLVKDQEDIQTLSLYNEYMNVRPRILLTHRCPYARPVRIMRFKKIYNVGLPYNVTSTLPLIEGSNILIEPTISKSVELRCVE